MYAGLPEWAEGLTKTTDSWVRAGLWILLAVGIGLVCVALIRAFRRDPDAEAMRQNPGNGWRVSRLIMRKTHSLRRVEALCQDFLAQPHKTEEVRVLAARAIRQHRAEGGTQEGSWNFWGGLQAAMEQHGSDAVTNAVTELDAEFPPSWSVRCWMTYRQWREKKQTRGHGELGSVTTAGKEGSGRALSQQASSDDWSEFKLIPLNHAACRWAGLPPTDTSLRDPRAQEELARLCLAVKQRKIEHRMGDNYHVLQFFFNANPSNDQFSREALVRYAEESGREIPAFLRQTHAAMKTNRANGEGETHVVSPKAKP